MTTETHQTSPSTSKTKSADSSGSTSSPGSTGSNPTPDPSGGDLGQLLDNLRNIENKDDQVAAILSANWQKFVGAVVVLLLLTWLIQRYQEAQNFKGGEASNTFSTLQESFAKFAGDSASPEALAEFQTNLRTLTENHASSIYAQLGQLYAARADIANGNTDAALARLKSFAPETAVVPLTGSTVTAPERFLAELAALLKARILVSRESDRAEGRSLLKTLAENADTVAVEALLSLINSARTDAERKDAEDLRGVLVLKRPTLAPIINRETSAGSGAILPNDLSN